MSEQIEGGLGWRVAELEKENERHRIDLYVGRGKADPSITARLDRQENAMEEREKKESRTHGYVVTAFFLMLATLFTLIGNLIAHKL